MRGILTLGMSFTEHGEFEQRPSAHLIGKGCKRCALERFQSNIGDFIKKANQKHSNKYNYSKVNYVNSNTKITIICPEHGEFKKTPNIHLSQKQGCKKCKYEEERRKKKPNS